MARAQRKTPEPDNPLLTIQEDVSTQVTQALDAFGRLRDQAVEAVFHAVYGSPALQAWLGISQSNGRVRPKPGTSPAQRAELAAIIKELRATMDRGGPVEAAVRAHVYIAMGQKSIDARCFEALRQILKAHPEITLSHYKETVRRQWAMLVIDQNAALKTLPQLLPADDKQRRELFDAIRQVITAAGDLDAGAKRRFDEIEGLFGVDAARANARHGDRVEVRQ
jgi:hypothetical protein